MKPSAGYCAALLTVRQRERRRPRAARACLGLIAVIAVTSLGLRAAEDRFTQVWDPGFPKTPPFLSGPVGLLFTNLDGFGAHVEMEFASAAKKTAAVSGELLGRGGKLLFVPDSKGSGRKGSRSGGASFIWDVTTRSGYILSEALQGYAPVASSVQFTNISAQADARGGRLEKIEGHLCEEQGVVVASSDGASASFRVWRAAGLKGFPLRIVSVTDSRPFSLQLSKVRFEAPGSGLFSPPDGFTKYESVEMMANEIYQRAPSPARKRRGSAGEPFPPPGSDGRGPGDRRY